MGDVHILLRSHEIVGDLTLNYPPLVIVSL